MKKVVLCVGVLLLLGCDGGSSGSSSIGLDPIVARGKFPSIKACLGAVTKATDMKLDILRDKPSEVSGYLLGTERSFVCKVKETGTEGTYVDGWYDTDKFQ